MPSPLSLWVPGVTDRVKCEIPARPFNGLTHAWMSMWLYLEGPDADRRHIYGSNHWSTNVHGRFDESIGNRYRLAWFSADTAPLSFADVVLQPNLPIHVYTEYANGVVRAIVNGGSPVTGTNTVGALSSYVAEVAFRIGDASEEGTFKSKLRMSDLLMGGGMSSAVIPSSVEILGLRNRTQNPLTVTGAIHFYSLSGTDGATAAISDAGFQDQIGTLDFTSMSTPAAKYIGPELVFTADKTLDAHTDSSGELIFLCCRNTVTDAMIMLNNFAGDAHTIDAADIVMRLKRNGGADITPDWLYHHKVSGFYLGKMPAGQTILATDTVTWSAPAGWVSSVDGPLYEMNNAPVVNNVGGTVFGVPDLTGNTFRIGQNMTWLGYWGVCDTMFVNAFHNAYHLWTNTETPNYPVWGPGLPTAGWACFLGSVLLGGKIPYKAVPDGEWTLMWDGAGDVTVTAAENATVVPGTTDLAGPTNKKRVYNITPTVFNQDFVSWRVNCVGSGVVSNVRFYPPGTNLTSPGIWTQSLLDQLEGAQYIRFMDSFYINCNELTNIDQWTRMDAACYSTDRYYGRILLQSVAPVADIEAATSINGPGRYFGEDKNYVYMEWTTATPHGFKTGQQITIEQLTGAGMTFDTGEKVAYHTNNAVSGRQMYVTSATKFIVCYFANVASLDGVTSPNWVSQDALPTNIHAWVNYNAMLPYQLAVDLCNTIGADLWLNLPVHMDQASYETMATYVRDNLDDGLKCYCEPGNEPWNTQYFFLHNDFYQSRWRELGGVSYLPNSDYYIAEYHSRIHDWMKPVFVAGGRGSDYKSVYSGFPSVETRGYDGLHWLVDHGKTADVITPSCYWNPDWLTFREDFHPTAAQMNDMNTVALYFAAFPGKAKPIREMFIDHRLQYEALMPGIEVIHYEGGLATYLYCTLTNEGRVDLSFAAIRHPKAYNLQLALSEVLQEAGSKGYMDYVLVKPDDEQDDPAFGFQYGATWGKYTSHNQKPGRGDGSDGKADNRPLLEAMRTGAGGDYVMDRTKYPLMTVPVGKAIMDWNAGFSEGGGGGSWETVAALLDGGFETPVLGFGTIDFSLTTPWVSAGSYAGISNNHAISTGNGAVPEGEQVAWVQDQASLTQTMTLEAGTYRLTGMFAQQAAAVGQTLLLKVDGATVHTFNPAGVAYESMTSAEFEVAATGSHTIAFVGTATPGSGKTVLIDSVVLEFTTGVTPPPVDSWTIVPALLNGGFETPVLAENGNNYSLVSSSWNSNGTYGGITRNSIFDNGNQPPPEGAQVGFAQNQGGIIQNGLTLAVGTYKLTGMFVQRAALGGQSLQLKVNSTVVHTFVAPSLTVWTLMESAEFPIATAGTYSIEFVGTDTAGGTMLVDDVKLYIESAVSTTPTVTPTTITLDQTQSTTFVAHDFAGAVTWSVVTASGGTINPSTGFYTAPTHIGVSNFDVTVQATDGTDTVTAHALVRPVVVTINETAPTVQVNASITLTGSVTGHVNTTGTWSVVSGGGTINATSGVFTAGPSAGSSVVRLTSVGNSAKFASVTVTVTAVAIPPSVTPNPISVQVNATQQFTAANFAGGTTGWSTNVGTITSLGLFTAQNTPGAGIVTAFNASQNANASVTVQATPPAVVTPTTATVISGGQQQFASSNFAGAVTWSTTAPSTITSGGLFTAEYHPSTLSLPRTVTGTSGAQSATATVTIPPIGIVITPANPDVLPSATVNLTATVTNAVNQAGTWSKVSGPGSINTSTGVFTASATEGPTVVRFSLTANVAVFKETTVTTTAAPGGKTEWYGLLPRALTTVSEARPAGQMTIKFTSPNVFDGPTALPDREIIVSITRGSTDARVCNLRISSRSGGTFTIEEVTGGPDANCQVGDWASLRWTNEHVLQMQEAINALEP